MTTYTITDLMQARDTAIAAVASLATITRRIDEQGRSWGVNNLELAEYRHKINGALGYLADKDFNAYLEHLDAETNI